MKSILGIRALLVASAVISPAFARVQPGASAPAGQQAKSTPPAEPATGAIEYRNTKYGFSFALPAGWKGYTIVTDKWEGSEPEKGVVQRGPLIYIRHPEWTKENPRQDIPVMIITLAQWDALDRGDFSISAAPVGPGELGRNRKYVFALPARFNFTDAAGVEEVNEILRHGPLHPFWSK